MKSNSWSTLKNILLYGSSLPLQPPPFFYWRKITWDYVKWNPLDTTYFKLNTDVSFIEHSSLSSCEGLIRNFMGCFIRGFTCNLGRFTSVMVELWGVVHGLMLACNLGINFFIVEMDSLTVVGMVKSRKSQN